MESAVGTVRIVVIDDSPVFLRSLCSLLQEQELGHVVGTAESAEDAFELVERVRPDLVLIDFQMPGMNGLDAIPLLRLRQPETKVILVTMHDSPQLREASVECGAHGFISKSQLNHDLSGVVARVLAAS
ncbi:MAG TPA: response regulator transcription factor [Candidatus Angelobacter sp.]